MEHFKERAEKILTRIDKLAAFSETEGMVSRTFGKEPFVAACLQVKLWMEDAGLDTWIDNIGNVRGKLHSTNPTTKTFVIGSHIDSVINAGKFDGPLGIIMGIDLLESLQINSTELPFNFELIAFCDEEGVRFHTTYLGSKVIAGIFEPSLLQKQDASGVNLESVLKQLQLNPEGIEQDQIPRENWVGYFEMHIEQGPVLYKKNISVAAVSAIAGQRRAVITFTGEAGHAGTVPMDLRKDALCAAAAFVIAVEEKGLKLKDAIVATVGILTLNNAASNVIPGEVKCTLDLRSADQEILESAFLELKNKAENIASDREIDLSFELVQNTMPMQCDTKLTNILLETITSNNFPGIRLASGAGHDAVAISQIAPVSMMFIRCYKGISHNPAENVELKDVLAAIQVAEAFIQNIIKNY